MSYLSRLVFQLDALMRQYPDFVRVMDTDRVKAISTIVNQLYDDLDDMELQIHVWKQSLSVANRLLKSVQRSLLDY